MIDDEKYLTISTERWVRRRRYEAVVQTVVERIARFDLNDYEVILYKFTSQIN